MELTSARWFQYYGNNDLVIKPPDILAGGSVSFLRHIHYSLSQELWEDLIHRLCINGLCIYRPDDMQWTTGWLPGHCCIHLDYEGFVTDIEFTPYGRK